MGVEGWLTAIICHSLGLLSGFLFQLPESKNIYPFLGKEKNRGNVRKVDIGFSRQKNLVANVWPKVTTARRQWALSVLCTRTSKWPFLVFPSLTIPWSGYTGQRSWYLVFGWSPGPCPRPPDLPAHCHGGLRKALLSWAHTEQTQTPPAWGRPITNLRSCSLQKAWSGAGLPTARASWPASSHHFFSKYQLNKPWFSSCVTLWWRTAQRKHQENDFRETILGMDQVHLPVELLVTQGSFVFAWTFQA